MKHIQLLSLLENHIPFDDEERQMWEETIHFVKQYPDCFERSLAVGHITGSAWIIDRTRQFVLLMHHRKLDKWFQPGGHADGEIDVLKVALREAEEETGLTNIEIVSSAIYDVDVHLIPANTKDAAHYHYDIRFLLEADRHQALQLNNEAKNLAWVALSEVAQYNNSASIMRMVRKMSSEYWVVSSEIRP